MSDIAAAARMSTDVIARFESGGDLAPPAVQALRAAFEAEGAIFLDAGSCFNGGPGVRLREGNDGHTIPLGELNAENDD